MKHVPINMKKNNQQSFILTLAQFKAKTMIYNEKNMFIVDFFLNLINAN